MAILGAKPMHHRLLHGGMQPPNEGEDKGCQVGGGQPLTGSHHHCLRIVGWCMLLGRSLGGILYKCLKLMDLSIYSLHNSALESTFWCILPCICVYVLQKQ